MTTSTDAQLLGKRHSPAGSPRRAFTLLELVMVLTVMATIAGIAAPRYVNALAHYRVDSAARRVVADLALARENARASGTGQTVTFRVGDGAYDLPGVAAFARASQSYTVSLAQSDVSLVSAKFGADAILRFNGFGIPDSDGSVVLRAGGWTRTITVDPTSGRATAQ